MKEKFRTCNERYTTVRGKAKNKKEKTVAGAQRENLTRKIGSERNIHTDMREM